MIWMLHPAFLPWRYTEEGEGTHCTDKTRDFLCEEKMGGIEKEDREGASSTGGASWVRQSVFLICRRRTRDAFARRSKRYPPTAVSAIIPPETGIFGRS